MNVPDELLGALGMRCPIIGAPMAGGPTTPALVAAVSDAGGLGTFAAGYLPPDRLRDDLTEVRRRTSRRFSVVAAGGIADGRGVAAVLALGAVAAQVARHCWRARRRARCRRIAAGSAGSLRRISC